MIPTLSGGAALKWLLVGGAVIAGGALLGSSNDKHDKNSGDIVSSTRREIPESEVPADILAKLNKNN